MTHLRKLMLEELERRNYSQSTARAYLMTIEDLARGDRTGFQRGAQRHPTRPGRRRARVEARRFGRSALDLLAIVRALEDASCAFHVVTLAPSANPNARLAVMRYQKSVVSAKTRRASAPASAPRFNSFFRP